MSGANHEMETAFLDSLFQNDRPVAIKLLHNYHLYEMVEFLQRGVSQDLLKEFSKTLPQWKNILNKVILTKVSYFTPNASMSLDNIELLEKITYLALDQPETNLSQIHLSLRTSHSFFSRWAKQMEYFRQRKLTKKSQTKQD